MGGYIHRGVPRKIPPAIICNQYVATFFSVRSRALECVAI